MGIYVYPSTCVVHSVCVSLESRSAETAPEAFTVEVRFTIMLKVLRH